MGFLDLFKKKWRSDAIDAPLPDTSSALAGDAPSTDQLQDSSPNSSSTPLQASAEQPPLPSAQQNVSSTAQDSMRAQDEQAFLETQQSANDGQSLAQATSSLPSSLPSSEPTPSDSVSSEQSAKPAFKEPAQSTQSQPTPSQATTEQQKQEVTQNTPDITSKGQEQEKLADVIAYPARPGSEKIFEGIYVRKERYAVLLQEVQENKEVLKQQLSAEQKLIELQEHIFQKLHKEESLLAELFKKVMSIELLTKKV